MVWKQTPWRWLRERRRLHDEHLLGEECEAFLAGRYPEVGWRACRRPDVAWAWINPVAHGDRRTLEELAGRRGCRAYPFRLTCELARQVVAIADCWGVPVERLQRSVLVPLELELCRHPHRPLHPDVVAVADRLWAQFDASPRRRSDGNANGRGT